MYRTVQDDTWDIISKKLYGNEKHVNALMEANPQYITVVVFPAGIELVSPEIDIETEVFGLPPWRR